MYIGQSIRRREDFRFLTGRGRYIEDIPIAHAVHAAFVRSPHAHARIRSIGTEAVAGMPGVLKTLTGRDWVAAGFGALPCVWHVRSRDGSAMNEALCRALAEDRVLHVGDTVAAVIAETRAQALDAAEALAIDYEPLPAIVDARLALEPGSPILHPAFGTNLVFDVEHGDAGAADAAFRAAEHVTALDLTNNRLAPCPMEPRSLIGWYDATEDRYTLWSPSQNPHSLRFWIANDSLFIPEHKIRVVAPDMGGGFGQRSYHYPEDALLLWASKLVGHPVRWTSTRAENLMVDAQARDHITRCRMAFRRDGTILGLAVESIANMGAYMSAYGAGIAAFLYTTALGGAYGIPAIHCRLRGVYTNTTPVDAYRGAGRPEAAYLIERLIDNGAREMGLDVCAIRARNFIRPEQFPYTSRVGMTYDSGNFDGLLDKLTRMADLPALREEQAALRRRGQLMGIGLAVFIDATGGGPTKLARKLGRRTGSSDVAVLRVHPSGKITALCGSHSHGQGQATTYAQIVADRIGCRIEDVDLVFGDTDRIPFGQGTYGSRSLTVTGNALNLATSRVIEKGKRIASGLLECEPADVGFAEGRYTIAGTDRSVAFAEVARAAYFGWGDGAAGEYGLEETAYYDPTGRNTPSAAHLSVVLVDPDTGRVTLRDFYAIDDVGRMINPMIVHGQVHGGLAQGVGQALLEDCVYDAETGQLLTGSFMDYAMPRADDLPSFCLGSQETPSPNNPLGVKGAGESGTIGAPPAVVNAVVDALWHLGVRHIDMPLTAMRVWNAMRTARG